MDYKAAFFILALLCGLAIALSQSKSKTPLENISSRSGCERRSCSCINGMPGMPGMPGMSGMQGLRGDKGEQGDHGEKGNPGAKGDKGDASAAGPIPASNWKQCVWKDLNVNTDTGKIIQCPFKKLQDNTALRVAFQGDMRSMTNHHCSRWYFKFNGNECSGPMTIDGIVLGRFPSGDPNIHRPGSLEGYCENLPRGALTVELWVGPCRGYSQGDAYTGWRSVSRIMVEEVARPQ